LKRLPPRLVHPTDTFLSFPRRPKTAREHKRRRQAEAMTIAITLVQGREALP
jgi:hypothetical protein